MDNFGIKDNETTLRIIDRYYQITYKNVTEKFPAQKKCWIYNDLVNFYNECKKNDFLDISVEEVVCIGSKINLG